jgi:hypothetical protein
VQRQGGRKLAGRNRSRETLSPAFWTYGTEVGARLHNYTEVRAYLEKEHPDWLRALTPRHINTPPDYWLQRVLLAVQVYPRAAALLRQLLQ